jgi:tripartite-type tricarboxylate transporter receptor subunit TctC
VVRSAVTLLAIMLFAIALQAHAQTYPRSPIRIIVPFPPGGGTDLLARLIGQKLNEIWGQPVVTDNRAGANGTIGAAIVAKSQPDGYTLLLVPSGFAVNPSMYPRLPFNAEKDFAPITQLAASPLLVLVHPSLPATSIRELIALAKARPGMINYASSGNGSPPHLATEHFKTMAGVNMVHIPYKGGGPAMVDLLAGHVSVYFNAILQALPYAKGGKLRALAVTSARRFPAIPQTPTVAEAGLPGYEMTNWYGLLAPSETPKDIVARLNAEVAKILNQAEAKERLAADGAIVVAGTPEQFSAFLQQEMTKFAKIVKASGMKVGE